MAAPRESVDNPLRKTPSQTRAMRTVDTLFEAATRILASEGEAGFTTNRIAERAGFSIGTLYQYFPSKEAIVVALVRRHRDRVLRELDVMLERCVAGEYGAEHALRLYLRHIVDAFGRGQKAQRLLARLGWQLDAPAAIVAAMDDGAERIRAALARLDDPELPVPDDADAVHAHPRGDRRGALGGGRGERDAGRSALRGGAVPHGLGPAASAGRRRLTGFPPGLTVGFAVSLSGYKRVVPDTHTPTTEIP